MATNSIRLDQKLIEKATIIAKALNRTPPKQIEHWAKIGEMMEDNPDLPYEFVRQAIIAQAERDAGHDELEHRRAFGVGLGARLGAQEERGKHELW